MNRRQRRARNRNQPATPPVLPMAVDYRCLAALAKDAQGKRNDLQPNILADLRGSSRDGYAVEHRARLLAVAPSEAEHLAAEIRAICAQIDTRTASPPGTAERGVYFWLWPPGEHHDADMLTRLHADAVDMLHRITAPQAER